MSREEILDDFFEKNGLNASRYELRPPAFSAIRNAMKEFAAQEARAEAIGFANFIKESSYIVVESEELKKEAWVDCKANEVLAHGSDYHYTKLITEHGLTTEQLFELFKMSTING